MNNENTVWSETEAKLIKSAGIISLHFTMGLHFSSHCQLQREGRRRRSKGRGKEERGERGDRRAYEEAVVGKDENEEEKIALLMSDLRGCGENCPCRAGSRGQHLPLPEITAPSLAFTPGPLDFRDAISPVNFISHGSWKLHFLRKG